MFTWKKGKLPYPYTILVIPFYLVLEFVSFLHRSSLQNEYVDSRLRSVGMWDTKSKDYSNSDKKKGDDGAFLNSRNESSPEITFAQMKGWYLSFL